jgi:hypothetical protein
MRHHVLKPLLNGFSVVSLLIFLIILMLWGRSYWVLDRVFYQVGDGLDYMIRSDTGRLSFFHTTEVFKNIPRAAEWKSETQPGATPPQLIWHSLPFEYEHAHYGDISQGGFVRKKLGVPYWSLALMTGLVPGWRVWKHRRKVKGQGPETAPASKLAGLDAYAQG